MRCLHCQIEINRFMKHIKQHITITKKAAAFLLMLVVMLSFTNYSFGNNINHNSTKTNTITLVKTGTFIPTDAKATRETKMLYNNMMHLGRNKKVLFGHQDDLAYGSTWKYNTSNKGNLHVSDTKDVVGDLPALFGWDLGQYYPDSLNYMINGVLKNDLKKFITSAYLNGGINTISCHCKRSVADIASAALPSLRAQRSNLSYETKPLILVYPEMAFTI